MNNIEQRRKEFLSSTNGQYLLKHYCLDKCGIWQLIGSDGSETATIDFVEGCLDDVINYAVGLKDFWEWKWQDILEIKPIKLPRHVSPNCDDVI